MTIQQMAEAWGVPTTEGESAGEEGSPPPSPVKGVSTPLRNPRGYFGKVVSAGGCSA